MVLKLGSAVRRHRGARVLGVGIAVVQVVGCKSVAVGEKGASERERWRPFGEGRERKGLGHSTATCYG